MLTFAHSCSLDNRGELPPVNALYAVFAEDKLLYIGTAAGLRRRFRSHSKMAEFRRNGATEIKWNEYVGDTGRQMDNDEREAIAKLDPPLNKCNFHRPRGITKMPCSYKREAAKETPKAKLHQAAYDLLWKRIEASAGKTQVLDEIAAATGLTYGWLDHIARNLRGSPAVDKIECLYEYLSGKPLKL